ncbi:MAG: ornithine carbamoyltransferase [Anaerolineae bacterium]|nr:ornithine carbamoyltransferase [Anaerolineae bacterium]MDW8171171.1 ornithine carbamoyltransferase [Anaerolineae bacterium]
MKHLLEVDTWSSAQLKQTLHLAQMLKLEWQSGGNRPVLAGKLLGMVFQKPSLRTRVSFEVAMKHLGGDAIYLSPQEIGLGTRESIPDVARVLSGYVQGIMARVYEHAHVEELARWASVPVINGLSDSAHPCQALADILTIAETFGELKGLKVAYIGDGNNVAASLLLACAQFGLDFSIATPVGYELPAHVIQKAHALNDQIEIKQCHDVHLAAQSAHVLYTDTWISMGQEAEAEQRRAVFRGYQINEQLLSLAHRRCIVLHCLPAHRGEEITDSVADGPRSAIFQQAENRLHVQKAILVQLLVH